MSMCANMLICGNMLICAHFGKFLQFVLTVYIFASFGAMLFSDNQMFFCQSKVNVSPRKQKRTSLHKCKILIHFLN